MNNTEKKIVFNLVLMILALINLFVLISHNCGIWEGLAGILLITIPMSIMLNETYKYTVEITDEQTEEQEEK